MAKMITLSFKDSEMELYEYVKSKSSPSIYIKELVANDMNGVVKEKDIIKDVISVRDEEPKQNNIKLSALKMSGR